VVPAGSVSPMQWTGTTARNVSGTILRTHEIANAGSPILDGIDRRGRAPTWTSSRAGGRNTISITLANTLE
jgi:hypothetical protein